MGFEHVAQATRAAAGEVFDGGADPAQHAFADRGAEGCVGCGGLGRQAGGDEVLRGRVVVDRDRLDGRP